MRRELENKPWNRDQHSHQQTFHLQQPIETDHTQSITTTHSQPSISTYLNEESQHIRHDEDQRDAFRANEQIPIAPQPPAETAEEDIVGCDESTRGEDDERVLGDVETFLGRVTCKGPSEGDTAGVDWWGGGQLASKSGRGFDTAGGRRRKVRGEGGREGRGVGRY